MARIDSYFFLGLCASLLLAACGGGGGDSSSGGDSALDVSLSATTVSFTAGQYDTGPPAPQVVTASARGGRVYLELSGYTGRTLNCPGGTSSSCTISVNVSSPAGRTLGTTTDTIFVRVCSDEFCTNVVRTREISVAYTITAGVGLTTTPATATITADQGDASASTSLALSFTNGTATSWSAEVTYPAGNGSNWLTATPSGNSLSLTASSLAPETYSANVRITYGGTNWTNTVTLPVTYLVRSQPSVEFVSPYVAYTGDPRPVIVRGKGFDRMTHPLQFNGVDAVHVVQVSPTELQVTPPAFATPGTYAVSIANDRGLATSSGKYTVLAPHTWPYTVVTLPALSSTLLNVHAYFDAERQTGYFTRAGGVIEQVRYSSGLWSTGTLPLANPHHFDISPDGERLYTVNSTGDLIEFDLDTQSIVRTHSFAQDLTDVAVLNSGETLIHSLNSSARYNFALGRQSHVQRLLGFAQVSFVNPDRSRVIAMTTGTGEGNWIYDERTAEFRTMPVSSNVGVWNLATDRAGTRIVARNEVFDGSGTLLGSLQGIDGYYGVAVNPQGTRAYVVYNRTAPDSSTLQVFDISAAAGPFPQMGATITLPDFLGRYATLTRISLDGRYLFLFGSSNFIVMPVP